MSGLVVRDLTVSYGASAALDSISFEVAPGELVAIIGANGAGKSSLLRALSGLVPVQRGVAMWNELNILEHKPENLVRAGIVHVAEGKSVIPELTVEENLDLGGIWQGKAKSIAPLKEKVLELFPRLRERLSQRADTLSGGERQMLAIGRALICRPKLLLLDEPSLGLAPLIIEEIFVAITRLRSSHGLTVVLVEQNALSALAIADRGIIFNLGQIVATGSSQELINDPVLRSSYLGY